MTISIRLKIKTLYKDLSPKEQAIADYILENPSKVSHSSISDLANELGMADSTFFQFTKKLGYNGFKDFKMAMLMQENDLSAISFHENIQQSDNELTMAVTAVVTGEKTAQEALDELAAQWDELLK